MTANDIVYTALRRIGSVAPGENPTAAEAFAGLETLNDMIDGWRTERLMVWSTPRLVFPLLHSPMTVGPGADVDIPRPARIERIGVMVYTNAANFPLELPVRMNTVDEWAAIPVKNVGAAIPREVWDDEGFPWRTLAFWPTPSANLGLVLYVWQMIETFQDLSTDYQFPPGYGDALKWGLALRLASEFGGNTPPQVPAMAAETKAKIKSINHPSLIMRCDEGLVASGRKLYNWLSDSPTGSR